MNTRWMRLSLSPLISMNIQEGGQENVAVFWLLSHRSSVAGSTAGQMTEREKERETWRGEGDMPVCGIWKELLLAVLDIYSFLKQCGVWRKRPVVFLMLQWEQGAFFCTCPNRLWCANVRTCLLTCCWSIENFDWLVWRTSSCKYTMWHSF